jgi:hypothetical protein
MFVTSEGVAAVPGPAVLATGRAARFFLLACSSCVDVTPGSAERSSVKYLAKPLWLGGGAI